MKVLHSTFSLSRLGGGVYEVLRELMTNLTAINDVNVQVIGPEDAHTVEDAKSWNCPSFAYKTIGPAAFGYSKHIAQSYESFLPDVAHIHGLWMHYSSANHRYCSRKNVPYIISPHGMLDRWALQNSRWKKGLARSLFENRHLKHATCLHALCEAEAREFRRLGLTNPISIIPNGVTPLEPTSTPPKWDTAFSTGRPVMLFLGRLHPKKGILEFLDTWHQVRDQRKTEDWGLAIAGWDQSGYMQQLQHKIDLHKMQRDVRLIGPVFGSEKAAALFNASAFVLPSFSEGLPVAVLEAWSAALPVVMTPACNLPEGFQRSAAAKIEGNANQMATGLRDFLSLSSESRQEMGHSGKELVIEKYLWKSISSQFAEVYSWMFGEGSQPQSIVG